MAKSTKAKDKDKDRDKTKGRTTDKGKTKDRGKDKTKDKGSSKGNDKGKTRTKDKDKGGRSKDVKPQKSSKYTDPELRERLKEKVVAEDRGGRKGQWSARKAQLLAQEYERAGGGYTTPRDASQRHLSEWTDQEWQTKDGEARARKDGTTKRYLPKEAWEELSPAEREQTEVAKEAGTRHGKQHVPNAPAAARAGSRARPPLDGYDDMTVADVRSELPGLDRRALTRVRDYEAKHKNRSTVLAAVSSRLDR